MTDIVERLRSRAWEDRQHRKYREEAADEIERMTAEIAALLAPVKITDAMVEAALAAFYPIWPRFSGDDVQRVCMCAAIEAALTTKSAQISSKLVVTDAMVEAGLVVLDDAGRYQRPSLVRKILEAAIGANGERT